MSEDGRIRDPRVLEGHRREVDYAEKYFDYTGLVEADAKVAANLVEIVRRIGEGYRLPESLYRNGIDLDDDPLLDEHGIKHIHLHEDFDVDVLLFFIEYRDFVLFLSVDGHKQHFWEPEGSVLRSVHESAIRYADAKAAKLRDHQ